MVRSLRKHRHSVRAGLRSRKHAGDLDKLGVETVVADLTAGPATLVEVLSGADAVINVAGAADPDPSAVNLIDRDGAINAVRAAEQAGVARYIQLSAQFADAPDQGDRLVRSILMAKQVSDGALRRSGMVWTIVRPGTLTDEHPSGRVKISGHLEPGSVSRADVAAVLVATLAEPMTENRGFDLLSGEIPVPTALSALG